MKTVYSVAGELVKCLAEEGFTVYLSFDEDGDASILTSWRNSGDAHGRYGVVAEDGLHTYALIGFQGRPKGASADVSIERFVEAMKQFRSNPMKIPDLG